MELFEITIALLLAGAVVASLARRVGAPYPAFLAVAGAVLAFLPGMPEITPSPDLVLTLFVAPALLDAAYDSSPRDLRDNILPITLNAVGIVVVTVAAVAVAARWLRPDMPWPVAIVLGAIVAPPDASAASAVLRALRPPHRVLVILEGESLFNDATALLIYRVGTAAALAGWQGWSEVPALVFSLVGGVALGAGLGWLFPRWTTRIADIPTAVVFQFIGTFAVWMLATRLGLSAVLTMLAYGMSIARWSPKRMSARARIDSYAVWTVAVFVLNVLAFILAGLQLRPILAKLPEAHWQPYMAFAALVVAVVILTRFVLVMAFNTAVRWKHRRYGARMRRRMILPTSGTGVLIGWCGMRGVVTLATALALPATPGDGFPFRDLILCAAFAVVLGTLVLQGLTLRPLIAVLPLPDDDQVEREIAIARARSARAALAALSPQPGGEDSPYAQALRREYEARADDADGFASAADHAAHQHAVHLERLTISELRAQGEIGDDAFNLVEAEIDWSEMYRIGRLRTPDV